MLLWRKKKNICNFWLKKVPYLDLVCMLFIHPQPAKCKLTLLMLNMTCPVLANSVDPDQLASEEANWSGSALFVIKYVNFYQKSGSSNLIGWKLEVGMASNLFSKARVKQMYWILIEDFLPFFTREATFVTSWLLFCVSSPFWKGVYSKRREYSFLSE